LVRIVAVMVLAIVTIEGVILIPMVLHDRAEMRRRFFAEAEAAAWEAAPALVAALARGERPPFPEVGGAAVVVYDPLGRPLATTGDDPGLGPAAVALLARGAPVERGEEASGRCYLLLRLTRHEAVVGSIAVVKPADAMARATRAYLWRTLGLVLLICTFTALIVLLYLIRAVLRPVQQIVAANVATGAAGEEIIPEPKIPATELGEIMRTRNRMLTSLRVARELGPDPGGAGRGAHRGAAAGAGAGGPGGEAGGDRQARRLGRARAQQPLRDHRRQRRGAAPDPGRGRRGAPPLGDPPFAGGAL